MSTTTTPSEQNTATTTSQPIIASTIPDPSVPVTAPSSDSITGSSTTLSSMVNPITDIESSTPIQSSFVESSSTETFPASASFTTSDTILTTSRSPFVSSGSEFIASAATTTGSSTSQNDVPGPIVSENIIFTDTIVPAVETTFITTSIGSSIVVQPIVIHTSMTVSVTRSCTSIVGATDTCGVPITSGGSTSLSSSAIGGIAGGILAGLLLIALAAFFKYRECSKKRQQRGRFNGDPFVEKRLGPIVAPVVHQQSSKATVISSAIKPLPAPKRQIYVDVPLNPLNDEIRVLVIPPASSDRPLKYELKTISINDPFCALSYQWGDKKITTPITLKDYTMDITINLNSALRHLRRYCPREGLRLWVDAISIDQEDGGEVKSHLTRMRDIYSKAQRTYMFLGDETQDSIDAIKFFNGCDAATAQTDDLLANYSANESKWLKFRTSILDRLYFSRLWIVQEVVMSNNPLVVCGTQEIEWRAVSRLSSLITHHGLLAFLIPVNFMTQFKDNANMLQKYRVERIAGTEPNLLFWVTQFANQRCKHDKDRIFGLLGLASDRKELELVLNYDDPDVETYIKATKHIILKNSLDFICWGRGFGRKAGLPSWVPDFTRPRDASFQTLTESAFDPNEAFAAGGFRNRIPVASSSTSPHLWSSDPDRHSGSGIPLAGFLLDRTFQLNNRILVVNGMIVDTVSAVSRVNEHREIVLAHGDQVGGPGMAAAKAHLQLLLEEIGDMAFGGADYPLLAELYPQQPDYYLSALSRTLMADRDENGKRLVFPQGFFQLNDPTHFADPPPLGPDYRPDIPAVLRARAREGTRMQSWEKMMGRKFMVTEGGLMGLGPPDAAKGDKVVVLFGCSVPVLLRNPASKWWTFVGESYVHGIMDGEMIENVAQTGKGFQTFGIE
ncbi:hypothetical protein MMC11_003349 [Xylographa trunciseda]|nr:hypothetical protein [Xylographa trunciseda]